MGSNRVLERMRINLWLKKKSLILPKGGGSLVFVGGMEAWFVPMFR